MQKIERDFQALPCFDALTSKQVENYGAHFNHFVSSLNIGAIYLQFFRKRFSEKTIHPYQKHKIRDVVKRKTSKIAFYHKVSDLTVL